jgi:putative hydrolase of the HAD superfamily
MSGRSEKWVVFDLGGVLLGWDTPLLQTELPELLGLRDPTAPLVQRFFATSEWKAFDRGEISAQGLAEALAKREGATAARMAELVELIRLSLVPMPDKVTYLRSLADRRDAGEPIRVGYLSNMPSPYARKLQANYEWFNWFDAGIFSGDVGVMKPDPAIFELFSAKSGASAGRHIFIDDYPHNLPPAQKLGWATSHAEFERDYTVDVEAWLRA